MTSDGSLELHCMLRCNYSVGVTNNIGLGLLKWRMVKLPKTNGMQDWDFWKTHEFWWYCSGVFGGYVLYLGWW